MLIDGGYYYLNEEKRSIDIVPEGRSIFVLSAGHVSLLSSSYLNTKYVGRNDYQLIYVVGGPLHYFDKNGTEHIAPENSFVLYKPKEYQNYTIYKNENTEYYWVHFGGVFVDDFLDMNDLKNEKVITLQAEERYIHLFCLMRDALKGRQQYFTELSTLYLQELIVSIAGEARGKFNSVPHDFAIVLNYIQAHYHEKITVAQLTKIGMTNPKTLSRRFVKYCGVTPIKYITNLRIEKAKSLLAYSDHKINEISSAVGFEDPLYFSSVFRSMTGMSPRDYKNKHR